MIARGTISPRQTRQEIMSKEATNTSSTRTNTSGAQRVVVADLGTADSKTT
jgi:hypothetical protein